MRLTRIEKSTKILETLQKIESDGLGKNSPLSKIYKNLTDELANASTPQKINISMPEIFKNFSNKDAIWKFLFGGLIWLILFTRAIYDIYKHDPNAVQASWFCLLMSILFGVIGVLIPTYEHMTWNYIFYPILNSLGLMALILFTDDFWKRIKRAQENQLQSDTK
jgi:hypothetical protein